MKVKVLLDSADKVADFVSITAKMPFEIDLISGKSTYLDAKSVLGILSCNYKRPLMLDIHAEDYQREQILSKLKGFLIA